MKGKGGGSSWMGYAKIFLIAVGAHWACNNVDFLAKLTAPKAKTS